MKKTLPLLASFISLSVMTLAQPIIPESAIEYIPGQTYTVHSCQYEQPSAGGANQTWDFSGLVSQATADINVMAASATPSASAFTSAEIALYVASQGTYDYYGHAGNTLTHYGISFSGTDISYSNPEVMYNFPLNYSDTHSDDFDASFSSGGYTWERDGDVQSEVDAYGTLITPAGTFTDVLRMFVRQDYEDDPQGIPQVSPYVVEVYHYYKSGIHYPIMVSTWMIANGQLQSSIQYTDVSTGINERAYETVGVYPSPATEILNVVGDHFNQSTYEIMDVLGKVVSTGSIRSGQLDVSMLDNGIYTLLVTLESGQVAINKFQVAR